MDTQEIQIEIQKQYRDKITRYTYYQIALAVAAIGFSVSFALKLNLSYCQLPLGIAILFWAVSIMLGFKYLELEMRILNTNNTYFDIILGRNHIAGEHPEKIKVGADTLMSIMKDLASKSPTLSIWQGRFLYLGMIAFIVWVITTMYFNT
jgi:hypothetical protein